MKLSHTDDEKWFIVFGEKAIGTLQAKDNELHEGSTIELNWNNTNASLCHSTLHKGIVFAYCNRGLFTVDWRDPKDIRKVSEIDSVMSYYNTGAEIASAGK